MLPGDAAEPYDVAGDPLLAEALVTPLEEAKIRGIARTLRAAIFSGEYEPGARLPTRTEMAKVNKVSAETIGNVMRMLAGEGLVRLEQGRGSYVQPVHPYGTEIVVPHRGAISEQEHAEAKRRVRTQAGDDPAIGEVMAVANAGERIRIWLAVTAADSGRAAAIGMNIARYACPPEDGWDLARASVEARPA